MKSTLYYFGTLLLLALWGCNNEKDVTPKEVVVSPRLKAVAIESTLHPVSKTDKRVILKDSTGVKLLKIRSEKNAPVDTTVIAVSDSLWNELEKVATVNVPPKFTKEEIAKRSDVCRSIRSNSLTVWDTEGSRLFNYHWDCSIIKEYSRYLSKVRGAINVIDPQEKTQPKVPQ